MQEEKKVLTQNEATDKLKSLSSLKPSELWDIYPEREKFEEKIVVEYDKVNADPILVLDQFEKYLKIPKRKPWIVDKICKNIRREFGMEPDPASTINLNQDENIVENY